MKFIRVKRNSKLKVLFGFRGLHILISNFYLTHIQYTGGGFFGKQFYSDRYAGIPMYRYST